MRAITRPRACRPCCTAPGRVRWPRRTPITPTRASGSSTLHVQPLSSRLLSRIYTRLQKAVRRIRGKPTSPLALRQLVTALGIGQIISWGTLFYTIAVLGPPMAQALRVSDVMLYGSFTAGLFVSGIASPWVGSRIDRRGGRAVLASGSALGALACVLLATSVNGAMMLAGWLR